MDTVIAVTVTKDGPVVTHLKLDGIFRGEYINQRNTKAPPRGFKIDIP